MPFKKVFISPPWPHVRGDSVSALSLVLRAQKNAGRGCGQHYEIYQYRVMAELFDILTNLTTGDAAIFGEVAASCGYSDLNPEAIDEAYEAYLALISEIRREQA